MTAGETICRMCELVVTSKNRVKSHGISNSVSYRLIKSKVGEYRIGVDGDARAFNADQSGITEKNVFCRECDESLSAYEDERKRFFDENPLIDKLQFILVKGDGYDQNKIKLAFLADLVRCSLFQQRLYNGISLGGRHEGRLIDILVTGGVESVDEYTVVVAKYSDDSGGNIIDEFMMFPRKIRLSQGRVFYQIIYPRGWMVLIKVDSQVVKGLSQYSLGATRDIYVMNGGDILQSKFGQSILDTVQRSAGVARLNPEK